jgi:RNA polymerase sigma-70 factor (ECF subfamily)
MSSRPQITQLLVDWSNGDEAALKRLMPLMYEELRRLAHSYMRNERVGHTLETGALVNEAYLKLIDQRQLRCRDRTHFIAIACRLMRRVLVDHARTHTRQKRGGGDIKITLEDAAGVSTERSRELLALDEALDRLADLDPRRSRVVELRMFGGLSNDEIAEELNLSTKTVTRDWRMAQAWLRRELTRD